MPEHELSMLFKDLNVAYVPIYSMFDHQTKLVDLNCDGNVNRWMTNFYKSGQTWKKMTIFGPCRDLAKTYANFKLFKDKLDANFKNFEYIEFNAFSGGAKKQRSTDFSIEFASKFGDEIFDNDIVIVESQELFRQLFADKINRHWKGNLIYWCPVCATSKKTRTFLEASKMIDLECFREADRVIVATDEQAEYVKECCSTAEITILKEFIDRSLPMFKDYTIDNEALSIIENELKNGKTCIYLPFRLSDEGYRIWDILDSVFIKLMSDELVVFAPNLNGASVDELVKLCKENGSWLGDQRIRSAISKFKTISSSRDAYYTLIDKCPDLIIPYFEDWKFVMHAAVDELILGEKKPACLVMQSKHELDTLMENSNRLSRALGRIDIKKDVMDKVFKTIVNSRSFKQLVLKYGSKANLPSFVFTGVGKNWYVCEKVVKTFISMGIQAQALDPNHALHGDLGMLRADGDKVLVFVSRSGTTAELVKLAKVVKAFKEDYILSNLETIALFLNHEKPNFDLFDIWIYPDDPYILNSIYEFDERDLVPSLSINILQMILDLFGVLLYEGRNVLVDGYVYNHLSGGNGEKLGGAEILKGIN